MGDPIDEEIEADKAESEGNNIQAIKHALSAAKAYEREARLANSIALFKDAMRCYLRGKEHRKAKAMQREVDARTS